MNPQALISHLGDLPWPKALVYGLVAAAAYYFLMFNDGASIQQQLDSAGTALTTAKHGLEQTKKAITDADKFEKEVTRLQLEFKKIHEFMPENLGPSFLTELVNREAGTAGAVVSKLEPQSGSSSGSNDKDKADFYDSSRMALVLEGTFPQLTKFFSNLSKLPRLLVFEDVKISQGVTGSGGDLEHPKLMMTASLIGYRYKAGFDPGEAADKAADKTKPGAQPAAAGAPNAK